MSVPSRKSESTVVMWKILVPIFTVAFAVTSAGLVGGPSDANVNDEGVQNALQFAVVQHNKGTNDMYINKVAKVIKVQKQVRQRCHLYVIFDKCLQTCFCGQDSTTWPVNSLTAPMLA